MLCLAAALRKRPATAGGIRGRSCDEVARLSPPRNTGAPGPRMATHVRGRGSPGSPTSPAAQPPAPLTAELRGPSAAPYNPPLAGVWGVRTADGVRSGGECRTRAAAGSGWPRPSPRPVLRLRRRLLAFWRFSSMRYPPDRSEWAGPGFTRPAEGSRSRGLRRGVRPGTPIPNRGSLTALTPWNRG